MPNAIQKALNKDRIKGLQQQSAAIAGEITGFYNSLDSKVKASTAAAIAFCGTNSFANKDAVLVELSTIAAELAGIKSTIDVVITPFNDLNQKEHENGNSPSACFTAVEARLTRMKLEQGSIIGDPSNPSTNGGKLNALLDRLERNEVVLETAKAEALAASLEAAVLEPRPAALLPSGGPAAAPAAAVAAEEEDAVLVEAPAAAPAPAAP